MISCQGSSIIPKRAVFVCGFRSVSGSRVMGDTHLGFYNIQTSRLRSEYGSEESHPMCEYRVGIARVLQNAGLLQREAMVTFFILQTNKKYRSVCWRGGWSMILAWRSSRVTTSLFHAGALQLCWYIYMYIFISMSRGCLQAPYTAVFESFGVFGLKNAHTRMNMSGNRFLLHAVGKTFGGNIVDTAPLSFWDNIDSSKTHGILAWVRSLTTTSKSTLSSPRNQ